MIQKKICMIGAIGVGKTSLVTRCVHRLFSEKYHSTIGVKVDKMVTQASGKAVTLMLWDLAGEDDLQRLRLSYLRGAAAYLLVVDGTRAATLEHAVELQGRVAKALGPVPFIVALNKCDMIDEWQLNEERLAELTARGWTLRRTSAKDGVNVEETFELLAQGLLGTEIPTGPGEARETTGVEARVDLGGNRLLVDPVLVEVLGTLQYAVFESDGHASLRLLGQSPSWLTTLWRSSRGEDSAFPIPASSFLANFLIDAGSCWRTGRERVDSGMWVEIDSKGGEHLLHATALSVQGRAILLLKRLGEPYSEGGQILQSARETHLAFERLQQTEGELQEANLELGQRVAARTSELARANQLLEFSRRQLMRLSWRLIEIQEMERRRIARELHDESGQVLTSLILLLEMGIGKSAEAAQTALAEARTLAGELLEMMRQMSLDLRPPMLDDLGLLTTLDWHFGRLERHSGLVVRFEHEGIVGRLSPTIETAVFRIIQEALTNVARHSGVRDATVKLLQHEGVLHLSVEDHGAGFDAHAVMAASNSNGLTGMRQRVAMLNGDFEIRSASEAGTNLIIRLPLDQDVGARQ